MTALWRLYSAKHGPGLDGVGGTFASGRWHSQGELVVYFGASPAIVVLERLAHTDPDLLPSDLRLGHFEFTDPIAATKVEEFSVLPSGWPQDLHVTRRIGREWRVRGSSCLLIVPSVILPEDLNCVLNPRHPGAQSLQLIRERLFSFDARLI